MTDPIPPIDNAVHGPLRGGAQDPTYAGILSFMRRRLTRDLDGVDVAILGVPFDGAVTNRPGARFGPQALRRASAIFDGDPQFPSGLDPFERLAVVDVGDCPLDIRRAATVPAAIEEHVQTILDAGCHLVTLGGDHFVTLPLLRAHAMRHGPLALVQFDAHQDTWDDDGEFISHGTFVSRAVAEGLIDPSRSIQIGIRTVAPSDFGIEILDAHEAHRLGADGIAAEIGARVGDAPAYLTFDIDCLDPAYAPGTGTPVAGGLSSHLALAALWGTRAIDWRGMDIVEVSPPYDHADITAIAGATVVQHYLQILAEKHAQD